MANRRKVMPGQTLRASPHDRSEPIEHAGVDELRALQLMRLKQALTRAASVSHYREKFAKSGIAPGDLKDLGDLKEFPFTSKDDLRQNYPFGMFAVPLHEIIRIHASSGTTGKPTVVGYTRGDIELWSALMARSIRAAGGRPGDKMHVAYGYGLFTGGLGFHYGAEYLGCTVIPISGGFTERQVQLITDFKPDLIAVTPSYLLAIADEFDRQGIDARQSSLRIAFCGAEPWTEAMRGEIEARAGLDAVDIYGLSEVIGPGVAQESAATKDGLHVWEDHFYPEIIAGDGSVLPDGSPGELVLTTLTKEAMPVIRYRTRDLTRLLPGTACAPFRRIAKITGRSDDMIILRGVNIFPTQIEEVVLGTAGLTPHFQLLLTRPGRMDELTVLTEAAPGADAALRQAAAAAVVRAVRDRIGVTVDAQVLDPGSLERSTGKLRRVIDRRAS
jgi:phenylacetate-CoA ligase